MSAEEAVKQNLVKRNPNIRPVLYTLAGVVGAVMLISAIAHVSISANNKYRANQKAIYDQATLDAKSKQATKKPDYTIRVETGATVMTKVWFSKDMKDPIIMQMLVTSGVCNTSKDANEQAMAQIKKPASAIHITCKKITELNQ